ncbi:MAG: AAA family ATPase [Nanoarchaeota archaeon]
MTRVYKNSTEIAQLHGIPIYMNDLVDACLVGRLNLFLQGDTGSGKTQLARDAMSYFPDRSLFVLGRNDMDTRELFQQINLHKLNYKPSYQLEPLVNPETGEVEWYYPQLTDGGVFAPKKLTREQADRVRRSLESLAENSTNLRELTSNINNRICVVDELPNCVPAVRAQLFNIFDGFIEISGKAYPFGNYFTMVYPNGDVKLLEGAVPIADLEKLRAEGIEMRSDNYSVGIATGNIGQQFTESSNDLGRAIKDRMHVIIDTDHFFPRPSDTLEILAGNTNPRVEFTEGGEGDEKRIIEKYQTLNRQSIPLSKLIVANYLLHGLDYCNNGESKRKMGVAWPNKVEKHEKGSDEALVMPASPRAAKSIIRLSQALDDVSLARGAAQEDIDSGAVDSMLQAYKLVSTYSGILDESAVRNVYDGNHYAAMDAVLRATRGEFDRHKENIATGLYMVRNTKKDAKVMNLFTGRWQFMRDTLEGLLKSVRRDEK